MRRLQDCHIVTNSRLQNAPRVILPDPLPIRRTTRICTTWMLAHLHLNHQLGWLRFSLRQQQAVHGEERKKSYFLFGKFFFARNFFSRRVPLLPCKVKPSSGPECCIYPSAFVISGLAGLAACRTAGFSRIYKPCRNEKKTSCDSSGTLSQPESLQFHLESPLSFSLSLISINYHRYWGGGAEDSRVKKNRYGKLSVRISTRLSARA